MSTPLTAIVKDIDDVLHGNLKKTACGDYVVENHHGGVLLSRGAATALLTGINNDGGKSNEHPGHPG